MNIWEINFSCKVVPSSRKCWCLLITLQICFYDYVFRKLKTADESVGCQVRHDNLIQRRCKRERSHSSVYGELMTALLIFHSYYSRRRRCCCCNGTEYSSFWLGFTPETNFLKQRHDAACGSFGVLVTIAFCQTESTLSRNNDQTQ